MQIVAAAYSLAGTGGSETYLVTVADHLQRLGHDVVLHTPEPGRASDAARRLGLRIVVDEGQLPPAPDVLLVQDAVVACDLAARYPSTPQAFVAHSDIYDLQLPPQLPDLVATVIVLYDRVERRIRALAEPVAEIVRLTQPVDLERFKPTRPLPERPLVAMTLGNYVHGQRLAVMRRACERAGVELRHVGHHGEGERPAEHALNDADVVFGKARVTVEAMACGRAAYVFDHNGGDGWVTPDSYALLAADNFGGQSVAATFDEDRLVADLALYDPGMGIANRDLAIRHHSAAEHAAELAGILLRLAPARRAAPVDAPLRELARLVRLYHRADVQAFAIRAETEAFAARAAAAEQRAAAAEQRAAAAEQRAAAAEQRAAAAEHRAAQLEPELAARDERIGELERETKDLATARDADHARVAELEAALAAARTEVADKVAEATASAREAVVQRRAAAEQAREAARLQALIGEVTASRRWRGVQAVMSPADRLRRASGARSSRTAHAAAPAPFVVGVARSGTTLLRLQLDSHPHLAIGPETGFGLVARDLGPGGASPDDLLAAIAALETWTQLGLDRDEMLRALQRAEPWSLGAGLRALYAALAARDGKPRWGDKTPAHVTCMTDLARALSEARFIHVIRDGRDVAASVRHLPFAPGDGSIEAIACDWRDRILAARAAAGGLAHYREVRYERLVREPEPVLRELCEFVELEFDGAMLRAHERAAMVFAKLPEHQTVGAFIATRDERIARHAHLHHPPDPARIGRWREALTADEVARFEAHAGELLRELDYA